MPIINHIWLEGNFFSAKFGSRTYQQFLLVGKRLHLIHDDICTHL